jgi:hypothetical protein
MAAGSLNRGLRVVDGPVDEELAVFNTPITGRSAAPGE